MNPFSEVFSSLSHALIRHIIIRYIMENLVAELDNLKPLKIPTFKYKYKAINSSNRKK